MRQDHRDRSGVTRLLTSLARNISTEAATSTIAADIGGEHLLRDLKTLGFLFESLCVSDLRIYCQPLRTTIRPPLTEVSQPRPGLGFSVFV